MKTLAQIRADAEREAKITFRTGYTCPDVALTEVAGTIARQTFDAGARAVMDEAEQFIVCIYDDRGLNCERLLELDPCDRCSILANWEKFKDGNL